MIPTYMPKLDIYFSKLKKSLIVQTNLPQKKNDVFHASRHQISLTYEQNTLGNQPTHLQRIVMKENKICDHCWLLVISLGFFYYLFIFYN